MLSRREEATALDTKANIVKFFFKTNISKEVC
jgi:hypothetical protein